MIHIGISGPIAVGKSTLSQGLVDVLAVMGKTAVVIPFASGLKYLASLRRSPDALVLCFDYMRDLGYDEDCALRASLRLLQAFYLYPATNEKPRKLYQYIGTELGRNTVSSNIWIHDVQKRIRTLPNTPDVVISDDLRFENESRAVDFHIALTVNTQYGQDIYAARIKKYSPDYIHSDHVSEQNAHILKPPHFTLEIDYTVSMLLDIARQF